MEPSIPVVNETDRSVSVILGFALLTALLDFLLGTPERLFADIPFVALTGYYGLKWAKATGAPQLFRQSGSARTARPLMYIIFAWVLVVTAINTFMNVGYFQSNDASNIHGLSTMLATPWRGFFLAVRAGITEEIPFRLFAGPVVIWLLRRFPRATKHERWLAPILATFPFALIVHPLAPLAYICSLLLAVIYFEYGAVPAILAHFLIDLPWAVLVPMMGLV